MSTNQTIDGVPRELLERLLTLAAMSASAPYRELRALLDAPACKACNDTGKMHEPGQEPGSCAVCRSDPLLHEPASQPQGDGVNWKAVANEQMEVIQQLKAAQAQGEPVAYMQKGAPSRFLCKELFDPLNGYTIPLYAKLPAPLILGEPVAWVECSPAWLKAGGYCATAPRLCVGRDGISHLHPARAEQPAPVAVVLPERRADAATEDQKTWLRGWNACLDELKRLNPSL